MDQVNWNQPQLHRYHGSNFNHKFHIDQSGVEDTKLKTIKLQGHNKCMKSIKEASTWLFVAHLYSQLHSYISKFPLYFKMASLKPPLNIHLFPQMPFG